MVNLDHINSLPEAQAGAAFLKCCGARRWAEQMTARRPFADEANLLESARSFWRGLDRADWLEAFAAHPKIGESELKKKFAGTAAWAASEQAGVAGSPDEVLKGLAEGNRAYEAKFGYIFIVCATGKSAAEMLALLRQRLPNEPDQELAIAAAEQEKITILRLQKMSA
jgi:2-oxo-4-hydroxy-4-carboxy-5-ureidoimidazoline decarboxylase